MAEVTYYVALPFLQTMTARRLPAMPRNARARPPRCGGLK